MEIFFLIQTLQFTLHFLPVFFFVPYLHLIQQSNNKNKVAKLDVGEGSRLEIKMLLHYLINVRVECTKRSTQLCPKKAS